MSQLGLCIDVGRLLNDPLLVGHLLQLCEYLEQVLIYPLQVKQVHFLQQLVNMNTFPKSKSQNRGESGRSINLSSVMLFAIIVPANLNSSYTFAVSSFEFY